VGVIEVVDDTEVLASEDSGRARTVRVGAPVWLRDNGRLLAWLVVVAAVAAYMGFHAGTDAARARASVVVARPAAPSSASAAAVAPKPTRDGQGDVV
jgi:hypothetical protein